VWARPTPGANDWKGTAKEGQRRGQLDEAAEQKWSLRTDVSRFSHPAPLISTDGEPSSKSTRRLNPLFVTLLMGLPLGWVDVESPLAWTNCEHWGMLSVHRLRLSLGLCSGGD
jgi:hypothetical protein